MSEQRLYLYKIAVDAGGAPAIHDGFLTLAICKPAIRRTARKGDWIFAFSINSDMPANRLVYIAEVTEKLTDGQYYEISEFAERPDCIYERTSREELVLRPSARFHNDHDARPRDVGQFPEYSNATVLGSNNFRYFGGRGTDEWKHAFPHVKELVENLGQGHRVNHHDEIHDELKALQRATWDEFDTNILGQPLHGGSPLISLTIDEAFEITPQKCNYLKEKSC